MVRECEKERWFFHLTRQRAPTHRSSSHAYPLCSLSRQPSPRRLYLGTLPRRCSRNRGRHNQPRRLGRGRGVHKRVEESALVLRGKELCVKLHFERVERPFPHRFRNKMQDHLLVMRTQAWAEGPKGRMWKNLPLVGVAPVSSPSLGGRENLPFARQKWWIARPSSSTSWKRRPATPTAPLHYTLHPLRRSRAAPLRALHRRGRSQPAYRCGGRR